MKAAPVVSVFSLCFLGKAAAFSIVSTRHLSSTLSSQSSPTIKLHRRNFNSFLLQSSADATIEEIDFEVPDDAVINIKPKAMKRLRELREKQESDSLVLRMGVRNGGCSGLSYVMDFSTEDDIQEDDAVDEYPGEKLKCVVDAKSMLYLYGLELDYSEELIGGGFKFFNPNAEESCGCGSSFGV
jgi:iron-sulfur cluster assembly protein